MAFWCSVCKAWVFEGGQPPALKSQSQGENECSQHHTHKEGEE